VTLHTPTLMVTLMLGFALLSVQLWVAQRSGLRDRALLTWSQGTWALLGSFVMLAVRPVVPLALSVVLANGLIVLGLLLYGQALHRFLLARDMPRFWWLGLPVCLLAAGLMLSSSLAARTSVLSILFALCTCPSIGVLLRHGWQAERSLRLMAMCLLLAALAVAYRSVDAGLNPDQYQDVLQSNSGQGLTYLLCFVMLLGAGFGFVLASFERVAKQMADMAKLDGLTGCVNRNTTDALLEHNLERGRRERIPVALALLDIDHFKQVNDQYGHPAGDQALKAFADSVRKRLRASDVLGRMGGEEFAVVLPDTDQAGALRVLEEVRMAVQTLTLTDDQGRPFSVTVSGGLSLAEPLQGLSAAQLYRQADQALYQAKHAGRNCTVAFGDPAQLPLPLPTL
jgi:diguanylate cyclase (GGDEF)-like protein